MNNDNVKLGEYLEICLGLQSGEISPEDAQKLFDAFFQKLIIRDYIPIKDKMILLTKILRSMDSIHDAVSSAAFLEMRKVSDMLLSYCVNLENNTDAFGPLFPVYDAIRENGLYEFILTYCEEDYDLFCKMLSDTINISHINVIAESAALFDNAAFEDWVSRMKSLKDELTPEILQGLSFISAKGNGAIDDLLAVLSEAAADGSIRELNDAFAAMNAPDSQGPDDLDSLDDSDK